MKIEILGAGTGLCPELGNVSCLIWNADESQALLLDCGSTVYTILREMEFSQGRDIISKIDRIFISHGHSDHLGSLDMLLSYRALILGLKTQIGGISLDVYFDEICHLDYLALVDPEPIEDLELTITQHIPGMFSLGCLFESKVLYSGDSGLSLLRSNLALQAKLIIHEVSLKGVPLVKEGDSSGFMVHVGFDELVKTSTPKIRAKTWLTHYGTPEIEELENKAKEYGFAGLLKKGQILEI